MPYEKIEKQQVNKHAADPTTIAGSTIMIRGEAVPHRASGVIFGDGKELSDLYKDHDLIPLTDGGMARTPKDAADGKGVELGGGDGSGVSADALGAVDTKATKNAADLKTLQGKVDALEKKS